jgi:hypothetical protein
LKIARCETTTTCAAPFTAILDAAGNVGRWTSITIGTDGLPLVSYRDDTNQSLKVARCNVAACTTGAVDILLDATANVASVTSITLAADAHHRLGHRRRAATTAP